MNTEQKAKAYDEALERAKDFYKGYKQRDNQLYADDLESIFPELKEIKESEGEKIRKDIMKWFEEFPDEIWRGHYKKDIIAWLEKQGEQKETLCDKCRKEHPSHSCQDITELGRCAVEHEQKPAAWSEEDEYLLGETIQRIEELIRIAKYCGIDIQPYQRDIDWVKSLKDRYTWKPSEEQMTALNAINVTGGISYAGQGQTLIELYEQLKKLKA